MRRVQSSTDDSRVRSQHFCHSDGHSVLTGSGVYSKQVEFMQGRAGLLGLHWYAPSPGDPS